MKKVLVTGASGFIGRHSLQFLRERGFEVHATAFRRQPDFREIHLHDADLTDPVQLRATIAEVKASHLLHFAWYAVPKDYRTSDENLRWVQSTIELVRVFNEQGGKRAVLAGTCFEYDSRYGFCSELLTPLKPNTFYGLCKASTGEILRSYAETCGISLAWGRIFFLYGPYEADGRLVPAVVKALLKREEVNTSHGKQLRDFMHVADAANGFATLLDGDVTGPVNIGTGIPTPVASIVDILSDRLEGRSLVRFGAISVPSDDPPLLIADTRRLNAEVGFKPQIDLVSGLEETVAWWKRSERI
jgi:nucleoside-diphosphate-sugar epimerase